MFARTCVYEKIIVSLHAFYGLRIMEEVIRHEGVVKSVCGQMAHISISQASACQACKAQSMCMSSDSKEKEMDAVMLEPMQPGDRVYMAAKKTAGVNTYVWTHTGQSLWQLCQEECVQLPAVLKYNGLEPSVRKPSLQRNT